MNFAEEGWNELERLIKPHFPKNASHESLFLDVAHVSDYAIPLQRPHSACGASHLDDGFFSAVLSSPALERKLDSP
jgi:hypothetical protein